MAIRALRTSEPVDRKENVVMSRAKGSPARLDQPRPSEALAALRENLDLEDGEWHEFLRHARAGFVEYEKARSIDPDLRLRFQDVPDSWWEEPEPLGYVFLRVAERANAELAARVAWYFLQIYDPEVDHVLVPRGTGVAWLHLSRNGLAPPVEPAFLIRQALVDPEDFFQGISQNDVLPLCRLILEGEKAIQAWDVHTVFAAVDSARIHIRAPFRLFNDLMAVDWISCDLKREFCRGLLGCGPEAELLREHRAALRSAIDTDDELFFRTSRTWLVLSDSGIGNRIPTLKRHAVFALVENLGEPLLDVVDEFFLKDQGGQTATEAVSEGVLDLIGLHAATLGPEVVRKLIGKATKRGLAPVRQAAYRIGAEHFGLDFVRPALKDNAGTVRKWAAKLLETKKLQPARKSTSKKHRN
jgi:hypothetical protein